MGSTENGGVGMKEIKGELKHDNCKDCHSKCEHAGKDREFCYRGTSCKKRVMTNGDKLRSARDEELASKLIVKITICEKSMFVSLPTNGKFLKRSNAEKETLEWLKKTAE